ncbi:MAG: phosphoribosylaminoimidazolesuccinocarboxamide synthase [Candidatus Paceibacterota bacterium]|jgi:phosphoribosylaminoimidazole-succinocarboxamide synthase
MKEMLTLRVLLSLFIIEGSKHNKVRRAFKVPGNDDWMLMYVTDYISVGDRVVARFKGKGLILNAIAVLVKKLVSSIIPTDLVTADEKDILSIYGYETVSPSLKGKLCIVKRAIVIPFECIVRIRLKGSLFKLYDGKGRAAGYYLGHYLPGGMEEGDWLPMPIFTPSTKASAGQHDENIDYDKMVCRLTNWMRENSIVGWDAPGLAQAIRSTSIAIAMSVGSLMEITGLIFEDTKFEFGLIPVKKNGKIIGYTLVLIDEAMTPDSSRIFYEGKNICKQFARDFAKSVYWDGESKIPFPKGFEKQFIQNYHTIKVLMEKTSLLNKESFVFYKAQFCAKIQI